jgi:hypothetical protein
MCNFRPNETSWRDAFLQERNIGMEFGREVGPGITPRLDRSLPMVVCTENLDPGVVVMKSAKDRV